MSYSLLREGRATSSSCGRLDGGRWQSSGATTAWRTHCTGHQWSLVSFITRQVRCTDSRRHKLFRVRRAAAVLRLQKTSPRPAWRAVPAGRSVRRATVSRGRRAWPDRRERCVPRSYGMIDPPPVQTIDRRRRRFFCAHFSRALPARRTTVTKTSIKPTGRLDRRRAFKRLPAPSAQQRRRRTHIYWSTAGRRRVYHSFAPCPFCSPPFAAPKLAAVDLTWSVRALTGRSDN